ncbi:MAG: dethiobiotin synthase [Deltaproteobacteria bacterium]
MLKKGLFVTGTDTGVGKTVVAAGLVRFVRSRGLRALAVKPIETGCSVKDGMLYPEDGAFLQKASEEDITLDECAPFRFSLPAAPYRAAAMEGKHLKMADLVEHVLALSEEADLTVVEGAGGLMVPVEEDSMMIDFMVRLGYPILLVARRTLGTMNHTLLSVDALEKRGVAPVGIILSATSARTGPEEEFTPRDIARLVKGIPVAELPFLSPEIAGDPDKIARTMVDCWQTDVLKQWLGVSPEEGQ